MAQPYRLVAVEPSGVASWPVSARLRGQIVYFAVPGGPEASPEDFRFDREEVARVLDEGVIYLVSPLDTANMTEVEITEEQEEMLQWLKDHGVSRARLAAQYGLPDADAQVLTASRELADYFEAAAAALPSNPKGIANWAMGEVLRDVKERRVEISRSIPARHLAALVGMVDAGKLSNSAVRRRNCRASTGSSAWRRNSS